MTSKGPVSLSDAEKDALIAAWEAAEAAPPAPPVLTAAELQAILQANGPPEVKAAIAAAIAARGG